jgi:tetratricopeptide (TPR) repeat protein
VSEKPGIRQWAGRTWQRLASTVCNWFGKLRARIKRRDQSRPPASKPPANGDSAAKSSWTSAIVKTISIPVAIAIVLVIKQWWDRPIAIDSIAVDANAVALGISGEAIADEIKARITEINSEAGELFQGRKLGNATVPLDVTIGGWGITVAKLTEAFNVRLTSARVSGHFSKIENCLTLQTTTSQDDRVTVDVIRVPVPQAAGAQTSSVDACGELPDSHARNQSIEQLIARVMTHDKNHQKPILPQAPLLQKLDDSMLCLALRVVISVSPDVAANYLFNRWEGDENKLPDKDLHTRCGVKDDVSLYSQVAEDAHAPPAERANALVGLSLVYARQGEIYEELNLARAATELIDHAMSCDGPSVASRWQRLKCRWEAVRDFRRNKRSAIAAWMQRGAAYSDYVGRSTENIDIEGRLESMWAYDQAVRVDKDYAPAYDAKGSQEEYLIEKESTNHQQHARKALELFVTSIHTGETPAAHNDLGWFYINHRDEFTGQSERRKGYYPKAMDQFMMAIRLSPDYWEAHKGLGYALFYSDEFQEAYDVLKPAAEHHETDMDLLRYLSLTEGRLCRFDEARNHLILAYRGYEQALDEQGIGNALTDWGQVLHLSGLNNAAIEQETEAFTKENNIYALMWRGKFEMSMPCPKAQKQAIDCKSNSIKKGLADLEKAAQIDQQDDFVLGAYLDALISTGSAEQAITVYRQWSGAGKVPILGWYESSYQPNFDVRLSYAKALLKTLKWEQALVEFKMLSWVGSRFSPEDIAGLQEQARSGGADAETLRAIDKIVGSAQARLPSPPKCHLPISESTALSKVAIH